MDVFDTLMSNDLWYHHISIDRYIYFSMYVRLPCYIINNIGHFRSVAALPHNLLAFSGHGLLVYFYSILPSNQSCLSCIYVYVCVCVCDSITGSTEMPDPGYDVWGTLGEEVSCSPPSSISYIYRYLYIVFAYV